MHPNVALILMVKQLDSVVEVVEEVLNYFM